MKRIIAAITALAALLSCVVAMSADNNVLEPFSDIKAGYGITQKVTNGRIFPSAQPLKTTLSR